MAEGKVDNKNQEVSVAGLWDTEKVCQYFEDPGELLRKYVDLQEWITRYGGIEQVDDFLRQQKLPLKHQEVLDLLLQYPMQPHDFYFNKLNIVSSSFYRRRKKLAEKLSVYLNMWYSERESEGVMLQCASSLPREVPPTPAITQSPTNISVPSTPLVGREQDVADILALLQDMRVRQITLTGLGGVGKTRLALQIGVMALSYFVEGVWFVPLAAITNPNQVPAEIAQAIGIKGPGNSILNQIKLYFRDRNLLLILDNFEQVSMAAFVVNEILDTAPNVKVIVTSRTLLHTVHEQEIIVSPLALPNQYRLHSLPVLARTAAIQLFLDRAQSSHSGLMLTQENAHIIVDICRRLEGLPLGIELAAARSRLLSPADILHRLENRLKLLTSTAKHLPHRQQSMRNAIAWSYDLLTPDEQILFLRLSVFMGGWSAEAAEVICQDNNDIDVLDGLESLLDNSLIRYDDTDHLHASPRFIMLETIREFSKEELLAQGQYQYYQQKHLDYFYIFAKQAEPMLANENQVHWLRIIEHDRDNIRSALKYALDSRQSHFALQIASSLWLFWLVGGHLIEGRQWLEEGLKYIDLSPLPIQAKALLVLGNLTFNLMDHETGQSYIEQALELSRQIEDMPLTAIASRNLGKCYMLQGKYREAQTFVEESLYLLRQLDPIEFARDLGWSLNTLGYLISQQGHIEQALNLYEEAVKAVLPTGDKHAISWFLTSVADMVYKQGDYDRAESQYIECLALRRILGDKWGCAWALCALGNVALMKKQIKLSFFKESLILYRELENIKGILANLMGLAQMACLSENYTYAAKIHGAIDSIVENSDINFDVVEIEEYEQYKKAIKVSLSDKPIALAKAEGKYMNLDDIVDFVLNTNSLNYNLYI